MPVSLDNLFFLKLGLCLGLLFLFACCDRALSRRMENGVNWKLLLILFVAVRIALFVIVVFVFQKEPQGDLLHYYIPHGRHVLAGDIPYRDFSYTYGFFFPYVVALLLAIHDSQTTFMLFATLISVAGFILLGLALRKADQRGMLSGTTPTNIQRGMLVLALSPLDIWISTATGLNQIWCNFFFVAALLLLLSSRPLAAALVAALSVHFVKLLGILYYTPLVAMCRRKAGFTVVFSLVILAMALVLRAFGINSLLPFTQMNSISSGNIHYILSIFTGSLFGYRIVFQVILFGLVAYVTLVHGLAKTHDLYASCAVMTLLATLLLVVSVKGYPSYLLAYISPFAVFVAMTPTAKKDTYLFFLLQIMALLCSHIGFRIPSLVTPRSFLYLDKVLQLSPMDAYIAFSFDTILVILYLHFIIAAFRTLGNSGGVTP